MGIKSVTAQRTGGLKTFEEMDGSMLTSAMKRNDPHCKANEGRVGAEERLSPWQNPVITGPQT